MLFLIKSLNNRITIKVRQNDRVFFDNGANCMDAIKIVKIVAFGQFSFVSAAVINPATSSFDVLLNKIIENIVASIRVCQLDRARIDPVGDPMIKPKNMNIDTFGKFLIVLAAEKNPVASSFDAMSIHRIKMIVSINSNTLIRPCTRPCRHESHEHAQNYENCCIWPILTRFK